MLETLHFGLMQANIINGVMTKGDTDGVSKVIYLENLNGAINIDGYTDVLSVMVGADGMLSVLISDADDKKQSFVGLFDLPKEVVFEIYKQICL